VAKVTKLCPVCNEYFETEIGNRQVYTNEACRRKAWRIRLANKLVKAEQRRQNNTEKPSPAEKWERVVSLTDKSHRYFPESFRREHPDLFDRMVNNGTG